MVSLSSREVHSDKKIRIEEFVIQFPLPIIPYVEMDETHIGATTNFGYRAYYPVLPSAQVEDLAFIVQSKGLVGG